IVARLKPGATVGQAQSELNLVSRRLAEQFPDTYPQSRAFSFSVRPLIEQVVGDVRPVLLVLLGAVGFVLLIACANVANLLLARALRSSRVNLAESLKEGGRSSVGGGHRRLRDALVVAEIGLSLVLLVGAGLLVRSFVRVAQVEPGFDARGVLSARMSVAGTSYAGERSAEFYKQLLERVRRLPGVESAGAASILPLGGGIGWGGITIEGYAPSAGQDLIQADHRSASPGYFETMRVPLVAGRYFDERDAKDSPPVAVIDENMARTYWPGQDPVGKRLKPGGGDDDAPWLTVVGVVGNVKQYALDTDSRVTFYTPHAQNPSGTMYLVARTSADPQSSAPAVTREARALDPNVPVFDVKTMSQRLSESLARRRFAMLALGLFALV